jgi:Peptidase family M23
LTLKGDALAAATRRFASADPTVSIASSSTVFTQVDLVLPRSFGRTAPGRLTNRIKYAIPADAPSRALVDRTMVDAVLRVDPRPPVVISSPLRGSGWLSSNGCWGDPTSLHREGLLTDGTYITPEIFAVDWIRAVDGLDFTGDGTQNSDWPGFGAPVYAVADGTVVSTVNDKTDIPPGANPTTGANPEVKTAADYPGNNMIVKIGPGHYAVYAHLQHGSVRVRRGQRVRTGQQIGLLGNSGNTSGPHLHFGIQTRPDTFSDSVPFEIDSFTVEGTIDPTATPPAIAVNLTGTPHRVRQSHPLVYSVMTLTP